MVPRAMFDGPQLFLAAAMNKFDVREVEGKRIILLIGGLPGIQDDPRSPDNNRFPKTLNRFSGLQFENFRYRHNNLKREIFGEGYDFVRFPILIKILDASDVLSVQVHPPAHQIRDHRDEPKDEFWYFVAAEEGAGIYAGLKHGTGKSDFKSALALNVG